MKSLLALLGATIALASVTTQPLHAQVLRGRVQSATQDGGSTAGVRGALVELRDSTRGVVARQISTPNGDFRFLVPSAGRYQIDARRIGYQRATTAPIAIRNDTTVTITLEAVAIALPAVTSREVNRCSNDRERGSATSVLWESAVTSMLSAAATMSDSSYVFDLMPSVRTYTVPDAIMLDISLRDERVADVRPWTSLPAADLAEFGYVRLVGRALEYVAPDVEALTSAEFLATHCLRLRQDRLGEGIIGVEFAPGERVTRADIRGVLWIDRATQELRAIDYTYAAVPLAVADSLAGGRVEFVPLDGGGWMPSRWMVRSPVPEKSFVDAVAYRGEDLRRAGLPVAVRNVDPPLRATRMQMTGADVQRVRRVAGRDTTIIWTRTTATLEVTAEFTQHNVTMPAMRALVRLSGSARSGEADVLGRVTFAELPDGEYLVEAVTATEKALHLMPDRTPVTVRAGELRKVQVPVLAPAAAVERACGPAMRGGVISGSVLRDGRASGKANVSVWRRNVAGGDAAELESLGTITADSTGRFLLCGVPRGVDLTIIARGVDKSMTVEELALPLWRDAFGEYVSTVELRLPTAAR
jgi:hypothetical protein